MNPAEEKILEVKEFDKNADNVADALDYVLKKLMSYAKDFNELNIEIKEIKEEIDLLKQNGDK
jgi:peptidoglycan hydrolase CwlO-like protein